MTAEAVLKRLDRHADGGFMQGVHSRGEDGAVRALARIAIARMPALAAPPTGAVATLGQSPTGIVADRRVSRADGPFPIDHDKARRFADSVLGSIDFGKRDIVIWAPGTGSTRMYGPLYDAVRDTWPDGDISLVAMQYDASADLRSSVGTGVEALRLVLEGIAARGQGHRVRLVGVSQGAWLIGETMADPTAREFVERAVLVGHPALALHQYADGHDPKVRTINHRTDPISTPVTGDPTIALEAFTAVNLLQLGKLGTVARAAIQDPLIGWRVLQSLANLLPGMKSVFPNHHDYAGEMPSIAAYLRHGTYQPAA